MNKDKFRYKLFGRFRGRKKNHLVLQRDLDRYIFNKKTDINSHNYNILDIGSGSGENAIFLSTNKINSKIITCELFEDGNYNLCHQIIKNKIENISLYRGNVLEFFDTIQPLLMFDEIWILFPDPWPKIRHHKRRLIQNSFFKKINPFLKKTGKLMIASDSDSYIESILKTIYDMQDLFYWNNQALPQWNYNNLNLPKTKFYKKAEKSNRNSMFFELHKI